jgi:tRNA threonylcarbamoyladenosine biosynthesis protein TsaB
MVPAATAGRYLAVLDAMRGDVFAHHVTVDERGMVVASAPGGCLPRDQARQQAAELGARMVGPGEDLSASPLARGFGAVLGADLARRVDAASWEPEYGRKAEAQVRWEAAHGRPLDSP